MISYHQYMNHTILYFFITIIVVVIVAVAVAAFVSPILTKNKNKNKMKSHIILNYQMKKTRGALLNIPYLIIPLLCFHSSKTGLHSHPLLHSETC